MKNKSTVLFSVFAILFISVIMLLFLNHPISEEPPRPVDGVLDLSNWSFEDHGNIQLKGEWSFYYNQLLTHEDFVKGVATEPVQLSLPCTASSMKEIKPFSSNKFYGTMRLVIRLPEDSKLYGVRTDIVLTSYRLYINGVLSEQAGIVGTNQKESKAEYNKKTTYFDPVNHEVELIYQTSDFTAADGTIVAPTIGLAKEISKEAQFSMGRDLMLFGMLLIMGIYHFGLYLMRTKNKAPLFFSLFCLLFSLRILLVGERFLSTNLHLGFWAFSHMAYICAFIGFSSLCGFLYHSIEGLFHRVYYVGMLILGISCSIVVLFVPYTWMNYILLFYAVFGVIALIYSMIRLIIGAVKKYPYALIIFMGFAFLGITFINDLVYQLVLVNASSLIPLGIAVFTFTQAYTLSARFSNAFTEAEKLSEINYAISEELKLVNSNLESLVEERTQELKVALAETELLSKTDYLTKLPNRQLTLEFIDSLVRNKRDFYIGIADLDLFKEINDQYGHAKGDEILVEVSRLLQETVGSTGFVGRWGGEEFIIVIQTNDKETIHEKAKQICHRIGSYQFANIERSITMTLGLCKYSSHLDINTIIATADRGLYEGKTAGRNQYIIMEDGV